MHGRMPAVLLRAAGLDALDGDAKPQPPHRQPGKIVQRIGTGKGYTVVGPDRGRQAELLETAFEPSEDIGLLGGVKRLAGLQITAGKVADRQRIVEHIKCGHRQHHNSTALAPKLHAGSESVCI